MSSRRPRATPAPVAPAAANRHHRRLPEGLWPLLAVVLALALLYPGPLFQGRIFASSDARNQDAFTLVGDAALARGSYPQWNPYLFGGMPTFGSLSYTKFVYPPSVLLNFLHDSLGLPPLTWLFAHLVFGALGMAFLLRRWGVSPAGRALGGLAWVLSPNVVAWCVYGHGSKLGAAMYIPWIVAGALEVLGGGGRRAVALTALMLGLQLLRGHVQITYYTLLAVGLLAVAQTWRPFRSVPVAGAAPVPAPSLPVRGRRLAALVGALALAFLLGAVLLLPLHGYAGDSIRGQAASGGGAAYDYATNWSFSPAELPTLVLPSASGFGKGSYVGPMPFTDYPNYFGILWLILAAAAAGAARPRLVLSLLAISLLALLVSFGRHGSPLFDLFYRHLPYFNKFRVPAMILILPTFALALLAALGADTLARDPVGPGRGRGDRLRAALPAVLAVLGGGLLLAGAGAAKGAYLDHLQALAAGSGRPGPVAGQLAAAWQLERADLARIGVLLLVAAGALAWAARHAGFRRAWLGWALAALVALDLGAVAERIVHPERALVDVGQDARGQAALMPALPLLARFVPPRGDLGQGAVFTALAQKVGHDRVWPLGSLVGSADFMVAGVRSLGGYHPAKLAAFEPIRERLFGREEPAARLADWLAGRIVAVPGELPPQAQPWLRGLGADLVFPPLLSGDGMTLYENRSALPRARLYDRWVAAATLPGGGQLGEFLDRLQSGAWGPDRPVALDRAPEPAPTPAGAPLPAPVFEKDGLGEVILRTAAPVPTVLLLADLAAPGWSVTVDGRPAVALRGDLVLRAVAVPAGGHLVRWAYHDPWLRRGLIGSAGGTLILLLLLVPWPAAAGRRARGAGAAAGGPAAGEGRP
ncbi:MAG: hypothetical protein ACYDIE_03180 [Candidatus Krumholzibacteriia bacterium]